MTDARNGPNEHAGRRDALIDRLVTAASMAGLVILSQVAAGAVLPESLAAVSRAFEFASEELDPAAVPLDGLVSWFVLDRRHPALSPHWTARALPLFPNPLATAGATGSRDRDRDRDPA